jgi:hypothetical protein
MSVDRAQEAVEEAEREHDDHVATVRAGIELLEKKLCYEDDRWDKGRTRRQAAV